MDTSSDEEDKTYMHRLAAGDDSALTLLIRKHGSSIMRFATNLLDDADTAEDVVQHVFTQAWQNAHRWKPRAQVKTWLYTIAHNYCLNILKSTKRYIQDSSLLDGIDESDLAEESATRSQSRKVIDLAMNSLPKRQKTVLLLRYAEGFSQSEAAEIMGVSEKALESLASRGKSEMAKKLRPIKEALL
ncbi:RNA polymerase sigma factor [Parendozoicomonas haliclonae]|uniref:ECF RNA polymerase sigma factor SigW n=1 Tax=Parendozoicomonas haliclonae TaxID=1960125 RepID=A0A1X7AFW7_9GAMM|nr:RNA polymerase sigma factor [Parendozoicomonas haliclonae]SMA38797.1 ECF RNA polymerase sigma factor SigW [Parendozoicomonas haliclonae]